MDRLDDEAILDELKGLVSRTLVYHYRERGREVWGLSKAGIDEACALLAKQGHVIRELRLSYEVNDKRSEAYFRVLAGRFAVLPDGREVMLDTAWGTKRQPLTDGLGAPNPHWYEQGAMKAARNARARLVGSELKAKIIAQAKETNRVRRVAPDRTRRASAAQVRQIREMLATVKLKDGMRERLLARLDSGRFTADQAERALAYLKSVADRAGGVETNPSAEPESSVQATVGPECGSNPSGNGPAGDSDGKLEAKKASHSTPGHPRDSGAPETLLPGYRPRHLGGALASEVQCLPSPNVTVSNRLQ